jgi:GNAT superfamily N-acetyltransferase
MASILQYPGPASGRSLSLCHVNDPKNRRGYGSVTLGRSTSERRFSYAIVEPAHRGRKIKELEELFIADDNVKYESSFAHRFAGSAGDTDTPFYARYQPYPFGKIRHGITRSEREAQYCVVAQNAAGSPAGFIAYSVALARDSDFSLHVQTEGIYTRKRYRGKGAATALLRHLCDTVELELRHLLTTSTHLAGKRVEVIVSEGCCTGSVTGQMCYRLMLEALNGRIDAIAADVPGLEFALRYASGTVIALKRTGSLQTEANVA